MTTVRVSTHAAGAAKDDCGCGCGGGCGGIDGRCCGLDCLVRPNFFCGQLLNDADLTAVVQWTRDRLALQRYRDGWGVVCGLDVTCSPPEGAGSCGCQATGSKVWINSGYAVDCCGNDLVVCEPMAVDLSAVCRPADDPCADPCAPAVKRDPRAVEDSPLKDREFGGLSIKAREQMIVDLYLRYAERPSGGQRPLFRGACADPGSCEPSRLLESPVPMLVARPLATLHDGRHEEDEALTHLRERLRDHIRRITALFKDADLETLIRRMSTWPLHGLCFIGDYLRAQTKLTDEVRENIGAWLMLDWLRHAFLCDCQTCRTDEGVPLARLWLWRKNGRTECCRPLTINNEPPFRRELHRDCTPLSAARVDLTKWFGARAEDAVAALRREGIAAERVPSQTFHEHLRESVLMASPIEPLRVRTVKDWHGVERIIGFGHD